MDELARIICTSGSEDSEPVLSFFDAEQDEEDEDSDADDDEASLQEAVASSSALVGESVCDLSPSYSPRRVANSTSGSSSSTSNNNSSSRSYDVDILHVPNLKPQKHHQQQEQHAAVSVGLMAQGLSWVRTQRERRRRQYLKNQAEQQLRVLQQAQQQQKQNHQHESNNIGESMVTKLSENSTFQALANTIWKSNTSSESDYNDAPEDSFENNNSNELNSTAKISQSGYGVSVEIDVLSDKGDEEEEDMFFVPKVRVVSEGSDDGMDDSTVNPYILSPEQRQQIAVHILPRSIAYARWKRLYSLARDGDSFETCLRKVESYTQTVLVIRTMRDQILGGFAESAWEPPTVGGAHYYGGANACLFHFVSCNSNENANIKSDSSTSSKDEKSKLQIYRWSGKNRYIQLCDLQRRMLAFGGGGENGAFGLSVEQDFQTGSTGVCETFDNEPLCDQETFEIVDMEIYGFLLGQF